jgi:hypothetical protein
MTTKTKLPTVPYCEECHGTNVKTKAWVEFRPDGSENVTEFDDCDETGNWCRDCDDHVDIVFPAAMSSAKASKTRAQNNAAREHGPRLLKLLGEVLSEVGEGMIDGDEKVLEKAQAYIERLRG